MFGSEAFIGVVVFFLVAMVTPVDSSFLLNIAQLFDTSRVAIVYDTAGFKVETFILGMSHREGLSG
jgi:hypothetical protein